MSQKSPNGRSRTPSNLADKAVHVRVPNGVTRTARLFASQGCVTLPIGRTSPAFTPVIVKSRLPDPATQPWPMGDRLPHDPLPAEIDMSKVTQAVNAPFEPASGMTAAFVVTWRGRLIGERYGEGITSRTPLEGWSMAKSLTATLMGILIKEGVYDLWQSAPIPEWQGSDDARAGIRIADILRMSSGLRIRGLKIRTTTLPVHIPIICISTPVVSIRFDTPRPGRYSGHRTLSAATEIPIRY